MRNVGASLRCGLLTAVWMISATAMAQDPWLELKALPATKTLMHLSGRVDGGKVELTFFKSQSLSKEKEKDLFKVFRIWRMEFTNLTYGVNFRDFAKRDFKKDGKLIYDGELKAAEGDRKFTFTDDAVKAGMVYAYWVASDDSGPLGPFPVKVRDFDVWWPAAKVDSEMERIANEHPEVATVKVVGHTALGRPIKAIRAGRSQRCVALVGAIHAGESGPELIIPAIERMLKENVASLEKVSVVAIPELNIDRREMLVVNGVPWYIRTNANGVDLNRNFPANWDAVNVSYGMDSSDSFCTVYKGPGAASEPETRAVIDWVKAERPSALFSFHFSASITGEDFLLALDAKDDATMRKPAEAYLKGMDPQANAKYVIYKGANSGSLPAWCASAMSIPGYDIEIDGRREKEAKEKAGDDRTDLPLLLEYQKRHFNGVRSLVETLAAP